MKECPFAAPGRRSSGPGLQMFPLHVLPSVQDQGRQAQGQIGQDKAQGEGTKIRDFDAGIVSEVQTAADPTEHDVPQAKTKPQEGELVPAIHAIDGKGGPPRQTVAPAFHAVSRLDGIFQAPGHQDGEDSDPMLDPLWDTAVGHVPTHAALSLADDFHLGVETGHKAQGHAQHQAQSGNDPPEEVHELIRGHDLVIAGEPLHHAHQHSRGGNAINQALQGDGVAIGGIGQDGDAFMIEGGV